MRARDAHRLIAEVCKRQQHETAPTRLTARNVQTDERPVGAPDKGEDEDERDGFAHRRKGSPSPGGNFRDVPRPLRRLENRTRRAALEKIKDDSGRWNKSLAKQEDLTGNASPPKVPRQRKTA
jgi:hypothetical protein